MFKVSFKNTDIEVFAEKGENILSIIRKAGLRIETPCNGAGYCGKCKVIAYGKLSKVDKDEAKYINLTKNERLACVAEVEGDIIVEILEKDSILKDIDGEFDNTICLNPMIEVHNIVRDKKDVRTIENIVDKKIRNKDIYKEIILLEEAGVEEIDLLVFKDEIIDLFQKDNSKEVYGVCIDIGTTGISYCLIDLVNGNILGKHSSLNPQTEFGGDVVTRISYCMENKEGVNLLQNAIISEINKAIEFLLKESELEASIYHILVSANTTMAHLLMGLNPESLAKNPYRPIFLDFEEIELIDIGLLGNKRGKLSIIPAASSYVGGDIVSGIIASDFDKKESAIFIDIGTNGELAALKDGKIVGTSAAAGPALEGMNIECGSRAENGAIEEFVIDEDFNITFKTINDMEARGICGSGLIDIVASFLDKNIIGNSGRWNKEMDPKISKRLKDKKFYITEDIYISQKDIRQIQLAKGAISSGIIIMLEELDIDLKDITSIYVSGAFGYHINPRSMLRIGLIPREYKGEIYFLGNTSLEGAKMCMLSKKDYYRSKEIYKNIQVLELSTRKDFQDVFVKQLSF